MFSKALSAVIDGIDSCVIQVEADVSYGLPYFELVGYLSGEVKEARERVRAAIRNSGYELEPRRIVVNLSPADIRKSGTIFDLAIACAILCSYNLIPENALQDTMIAGELSLNGNVRPVNGILPVILTARELGIKRCIVPSDNAFEGGAVKDIDVYGVHSLNEAVRFLGGNMDLVPVPPEDTSIPAEDNTKYDIDFADIHGQEVLKRSMEIAAAGLHNILLIGPPGSGKSMAAKRLPTILPPISYNESIEVSKIYSVAGLLNTKEGLVKKRPFRSPHHTITAPGLCGGGTVPVPGEISLAHRGVLFLDELTEFSVQAMEALRQPLEEGKINITRLHSSCTFPADFMLAAAMNPCKCGYYPDMERCRCTPLQIQRYIGKISRPLMDRMDITVEVKRVEIDTLQSKDTKNESSAEIRARVVNAAEIQTERYKGRNYEHNSQIPDKDIPLFCHLGTAENDFMKKVYKKYSLSARSYNKILKVARTIADLEGERELNIDHLAEAVYYKSLDRHYWSNMFERQ